MQEACPTDTATMVLGAFGICACVGTIAVLWRIMFVHRIALRYHLAKDAQNELSNTAADTGDKSLQEAGSDTATNDSHEEQSIDVSATNRSLYQDMLIRPLSGRPRT